MAGLPSALSGRKISHVAKLVLWGEATKNHFACFS